MTARFTLPNLPAGQVHRHRLAGRLRNADAGRDDHRQRNEVDRLHLQGKGVLDVLLLIGRPASIAGRHSIHPGDSVLPGRCEGTCGKLFAVIVIVIALASAVPIITHTFLGAIGHAARGHLDSRSRDRRADRRDHDRGRLVFPRRAIRARFLCVEVWLERKERSAEELSRRRQVPGRRAVLLVGAEVIALGALGTKAWAQGLLSAGVRRCTADPGAGRAVRLLLPLSRPGREIWRHPSRQDRRRQLEFLRTRSGERYSGPR